MRSCGRDEAAVSFQLSAKNRVKQILRLSSSRLGATHPALRMTRFRFSGFKLTAES
jgi:hypothetical protein